MHGCEADKGCEQNLNKASLLGVRLDCFCLQSVTQIVFFEEKNYCSWSYPDHTVRLFFWQFQENNIKIPKKKKLLKVIQSDSDNDNAGSKKKKKMKYAFHDDDDDDDQASNQSKPAKKAKQQSSKAKKSRFSEDDDDDGNSNDMDYKNYTKKTKSDKKKKSSTNHDDGDQDHGDDDYFEDDFDSDSSSRDSIKPLTESDYALRDLIFSLYNTFPIEELLTLIDTLPKRLHTVVAMRPFKDYEDLVI